MAPTVIIRKVIKAVHIRLQLFAPQGITLQKSAVIILPVFPRYNGLYLLSGTSTSLTLMFLFPDGKFLKYRPPPMNRFYLLSQLLCPARHLLITNCRIIFHLAGFPESMIISGKYRFQFFSFLHSTVCFQPYYHCLLMKRNMRFLQFSVTPASLCRHRSLKSLHCHLINPIFRYQITGQIPYRFFSGWFPQRMKIQAVKNQMQISPLHLYRCIVKPVEHLLRIPVQADAVRSGTFSIVPILPFRQ